MSKIPHGNDPYENNQNVVPERIDPKSAEGQRLKNLEARKIAAGIRRKHVDRIIPRCPRSQNLLPTDAFRIHPMGWWKCTWIGCPVGAHDLGEKLCPIFYSDNEDIGDKRKEAARDPIERQDGWWCCPVTGCNARRALYEGKRFCKCEGNAGRDAVVLGREEICPQPSTVDNTKERIEKMKQMDRQSSEEEVDVMEGGLEEGEEYRTEPEDLTKPTERKLLVLRLPSERWEVYLKDKASSSK
ncbi:hypothetical protein EAF04_000921 [Stromatinia cepivora]|nr:hypothetical protein EAF04_000921 [Stromatinia cepivora]